MGRKLGVGMKILVNGEERGELGVGDGLGRLLREKGSGGERECDRKKTNLHPARISERLRKSIGVLAAIRARARARARDRFLGRTKSITITSRSTSTRNSHGTPTLDSPVFRRVVAGPWLSRKTRFSSGPILLRGLSRSSLPTRAPGRFTG